MAFKAKFSLAVLLLALGVISVAFSACYQFNSYRSMREMQAELRSSEHRQRICFRLAKLLSSFDHSDDVEASNLVSKIVEQIPANPSVRKVNDELFCVYGTYPKLVDVDGNSGQLEVLALSYNSLSSPGIVGSVVALFDGINLVDVKSRICTSGLENTHKINFLDVDRDGILDVEIGIDVDIPSVGDRKRCLVYLSKSTKLELHETGTGPIN